MYEASVYVPICGWTSNRAMSSAMIAQIKSMITVSSHFFRNKYCTAKFSLIIDGAATPRFNFIIRRQKKNICPA